MQHEQGLKIRRRTLFSDFKCSFPQGIRLVHYDPASTFSFRSSPRYKRFIKSLDEFSPCGLPTMCSLPHWLLRTKVQGAHSRCSSSTPTLCAADSQAMSVMSEAR